MRQLGRPLAAALSLVLILGACTSTTSDAVDVTLHQGVPDATLAEAAPTTGGDGTVPEAVDPNPDPTPIALDDAVTTGVLDNGLTYFIVENNAPGQRAEIRLAIDAGSSQQTVAESGSAHFLEHMLFNGTEKYPANELDDLLRNLGMEIGPDINAYTSFDETVYELSLPDASTATIDQGLDIVSEWASNALIDADEVIAERGVVREEHRLRAESADGVLNARFLEVYTADSGYAGFDPIGDEDMILATEATELRSFYDDWYRPDNMAVVVVGDFRASAVESQLIDALDSLDDRGSGPERVQTEASQLTEPVVEVLTHPDGPEPSVSLDFQLPVWEPGTVGGERLLLADEVVGIMLQNYLDEAAATGSLALVRPFAGTFELARERRFLGMNVAGDDLTVAAADLLRGIQSAQVSGFSEDQLGQAKQQLQAGIDQVKSSASSKQDGEHANGLVAYFLAGHAVESVDDWYERLTGELESFTVGELDNLFRWEMAHSVPLLVALGSDPDDLPTQAELEAAISDAALSGVVEQAEVVTIDQLLEQPDAVDPADSGRVPGSADATWWSFDNGVTVVHEKSTIASGLVMVWAIGTGGRVLLEPEDAAVADVAVTAVASSGLGEYNEVAVARYLADSSAGVGPFIDAEAEGITAQADVEDIATLFELLTMYLVAPRVDEVGLAEARTAVRSQLREVETSPHYASALARLKARFGSDPRYIGVPTEEQIDDLTAEEALRIYNERFGGVDDMVVVVVGDVSASEIEALATTYVASWPGRVDAELPTAPGVPSGPIELSVHAGTSDSGAGIDLTYSITGELSQDEQVAGDFLTSIINGRLFDRVREELGASYGGGSASISTGQLAGAESSLSVSVDGDPTRLDEIREAIFSELTSLVERGPDDSDFAEAQSIVSSNSELVSNFDILLSLSEWALERDGDAYTREDYAADVARVSASDVQALAAKLISDDNLIVVTREPS